MASENEIRVGMTVQFSYGSYDVIGQVKEDRGPIGRGGRRLYSITFELDPGDRSVIELPADQLQVQEQGVL
jgi:hypothetical protein